MSQVKAIFQERSEFRTGVSHSRLAEHLACLGVERRVQGQRAVFRVLKAVPLGARRAPGSSSSHPHRTPTHAEGSDTGQ
jgi:hypothetical protein